jgi:serine/threonine protein kinase
MEQVLKTFNVGGRNYFAVEKLSHRGAFRVFDPHAGPDGDYRVLHQFPKSKVTSQTIEILRRLSGPQGQRNFPHIVDCSQAGKELFVVTEWVPGTNLRSYLQAVREQETARPSVPEVVRLVRGLVHGVAHYHRRTNIIHGDISPANIVITSGTKHLVLIDFGSAWPVERGSQREPGDGVTRPYAAPERTAQHATEDFRSDAFSLSTIAYEMLTLSVPYEGLGGQAGVPNLVSKTAQSYRHPSTLLSTNRLPRKSAKLLDDCLGTGLKLHPDDRFATPSEWISAWDSLHFSFQKGTRLTRMDEFIVAGIDALRSLFQRRTG